jgi:threonine/homoserine/homoserine lactone efflux protein
VIEGSRFILFMSAATLLAVSPGPGMLYVLSRTHQGGRREGFLSARGTFLGGLVHAVAAGLGLSTVLNFALDQLLGRVPDVNGYSH